MMETMKRGKDDSKSRVTQRLFEVFKAAFVLLCAYPFLSYSQRVCRIFNVGLLVASQSFLSWCIPPYSGLVLNLELRC